VSFSTPPRPAPRPRPQPESGGRRRRRLSPLALTIIVLVVIVIAVLVLAQLWTEVLWFQALDFGRVLWTEWIARAVLFLAGFLVMGAALFVSFRVAYKTRPIYVPTGEQATLDQYRQVVEPLRKVVMTLGPIVVGFFTGLAASAQWQTVLLAINAASFGTTDPQFGMDQGFYVFQLPALRFALSMLMAIVIVSAIGALITHYLYGGLRIGPLPAGTSRTTKAARVQLAVTGTILMLVIAANYWLSRYSLLTSSGDIFDGASYSDVHAVLPSRAILAGVAILVALTFLVAAVRGNWRLPVIGVGLMIVSAIAIGGIYPWVVQRFQVVPNEQDLEAPYIQRNIDATLTAFGMDDLEQQQYAARTTAEQGALREDADTTASIRLLDPQIVSPSFRQLQQNKQYYDFQDSLAVDRYMIDGQSRDTVIAVRELNLGGLGAAQRTWVNDHTVFTHGFGVVAAFGNQTGSDGRPAFFEGGIPSQGDITDEQGGYEPRIYFSPAMDEYSVVGAPQGVAPWELDYQTGDDADAGQVTFAFPTGNISAGPPIDNMWYKLLYAIKFGSQEILFSDRVTDVSQILYDRDPQERVAKVAPYLTLDSRVYPAVVDGQVLWIVDGYTTSNDYPYSTSTTVSEAITDSLTALQAQGIPVEFPAEVNYVRNSVKATVNAYTGEVTLYAWDAEDPILQAWQKVYPGTIHPLSEISGDLMAHLRYPEDLFKMQRSLLQRYHVTDPAQFFGGNDRWASPSEPTSGTTQLQPPYYLTLKMPGQDEAAFSLTTLFIPGGNTDREILTGFLAVDANAGNQSGVKSPDYGKLRLLVMPRDNTVPGPGQVQNNFNTNPDISSELNVLNIGGSSRIERGNQLTLPVGGGLLYVQPVYVTSATGTQFPLLRRVLVAFGDSAGFAETLTEALDQVFGGDSGAVDVTPPPDGSGESEGEGTGSGTTPPPDGGPSDSGARTDLAQALQDAAQAIQDGQAALAEGDFAAYGEAQDRLSDAIQRAVDAEARIDQPTGG
jgi:uncharacterized membrane protein (UPF0182 family)